jgi:hypothetical protein
MGTIGFMLTGQIITKDKVNDHLSDTYIEVFPQGKIADVDFMASIPKEHRTYSKHCRSNSPTPILVRLSYWETVRPDNCQSIARS